MYRAKTIETFLLAACVAAAPFCLAAAAAPATPKAPPLERYTCYQVYAPSLTYTYMGSLVLQAGNKYAWGFDKAKPTARGRYTYGPRGIAFVGGPLKGITGKFETGKDGRHTLELTIQGEKKYPSDDGKITWYANCDPHDPYEKKGKK